MDETVPLLQDAEHTDIQRRASNSTAQDDTIIEFHPSTDPENPVNWPKSYKWSIVALLAFIAFTVTFTCIGVVPIANHIVCDLDKEGRLDKSASVLLVTIWELGEAVGPLFMGPLSEMFGRYWVFNIANILFVLATLLAALSQTKLLFICARALTGLAVASNVLNPAIVGDIFEPEQRGTAMSLIMLAPLLGGAIGPAIAGAVAESMGWRQVLWMSVILATACEIVFLCFFGETYKVTILRRRAERLRKETGNPELKTIFDIDTDQENWVRRFVTSITRPFRVFFGSGVLMAISLCGGLTFTYYYILSTTLPDVLQGVYNLSPALTGLAFISFSIGSTISVIICNLTLDAIYIKLRDSNKGVGQPEYRLPLVVIGSLTLPPVVALLGWVAQWHLPLPVLLFTVGLIGSTLLFGYLPLTAYIVDAFGLYSASAMTAVIVARCLMGTFFPLTTEPLVRKFGYGYGFSVLGGISFALAPIPILLFRYGSRWRQMSKYSKDS